MAATATVACGTAGVVQTALHGDLAQLKRQIRDDQQKGALDRSTTLKLATAVAGRELRSSKGPAAVARVDSLRACAGSLEPVLRERASHPDDVGAQATRMLIQLGRLDRADLVARYAEASSGAWRAVAARAATGPRDGRLRRKFIGDGDQRVRKAALEASLEAKDAADLDALLEAARLDPDPLLRSLAVRAVGAIGGQRAVLALKDLWAHSGGTARETIVAAWAMPALYRTGGARELRDVAERGGSLAAIAAAEALSRKSGGDATLGATLLARSITEGTNTERRLAIQVAPVTDANVRKALAKATKDQDPDIRVMALARSLGVPAARKNATQELEKLAHGKDLVAIQARAALAAAHDPKVSSELTHQLGSKSPAQRRLAALGLIRLGDYSGAATALADDDPDVRASTACSMIALAHRREHHR